MKETVGNAQQRKPSSNELLCADLDYDLLLFFLLLLPFFWHSTLIV